MTSNGEMLCPVCLLLQILLFLQFFHEQQYTGEKDWLPGRLQIGESEKGA